MEECESCKSGKMKAAVHWEAPGKQSGYLLPPKSEEDTPKTLQKILEKCKNNKMKNGPYFESVEDMRIFLNGEDIDLEVFHLCIQPGVHIHVCHKNDAFPDVFLEGQAVAKTPQLPKQQRKGKPRDLDEFWEDCTKGMVGELLCVPWKTFFGVFSCCTKRYSKIDEEKADQKLGQIEKSFKKLLAFKKDKASYVSRDWWEAFFKWCKQEIPTEKKHELNFEPIVAIIDGLLGVVYCKGIHFMKFYSTNTNPDGTDESSSSADSTKKHVYADWDLYEEEERKQQKRKVEENKGKMIVKMRFSKSKPLAFRVAFVELGKQYNDENDLLIQYYCKENSKLSFFRIKEDPKHKKYIELMPALRRLYRLHYRELRIEKSDLPEGLQNVDEAAFMSEDRFITSQIARFTEESGESSDKPPEKTEKERQEERQQHTEVLQERLKKFNFAWDEGKMCPDVYTAVSFLLYQNPDISKHVRNETANWLARHGRNFVIHDETKLSDYITTDFDLFVDAVRRGRDKGSTDHIVLHAIAEAFNRVLVVITSIPMGEHVLIIRPKVIRQKQCLYVGLLASPPVLWSPLQPLCEDPKRPWYIPPYLVSAESAKQGAGNFGAVTKGKLRNETTVAIKRMHSVTDKEIFMKELGVLHHVGGPNIVQFYGASDDEHNQFLVFEWMPKGSLYNHIHMKKLKLGNADQMVRRSVKEWNKKVAKNPLLAISIAKNIANGMRFIHSKKIYHRDLTSKNVLLDKNYCAKICDFGLSCIQKDAKSYNRPGHICYLAPEVLKALEVHRPLQFDFPADVYSFAIILWELWTGQDPPPYNLNLSNESVRNEWIKRIVHGGDRPPLPANMPDYWKDLICKCWHPNPAARPKFTGRNSISSMLKAIHANIAAEKRLAKLKAQPQFSGSSQEDDEMEVRESLRDDTEDDDEEEDEDDDENNGERGDGEKECGTGMASAGDESGDKYVTKTEEEGEEGSYSKEELKRAPANIISITSDERIEADRVNHLDQDSDEERERRRKHRHHRRREKRTPSRSDSGNSSLDSGEEKERRRRKDKEKKRHRHHRRSEQRNEDTKEEGEAGSQDEDGKGKESPYPGSSTEDSDEVMLTAVMSPYPDVYTPQTTTTEEDDGEEEDITSSDGSPFLRTAWRNIPPQRNAAATSKPLASHYMDEEEVASSFES